ncbi:MAG: hypothetical protein LC749_11245 [Actinobacteria bacterium]|nr:hypothetical protein [Actinomycetota bacterium]
MTSPFPGPAAAPGVRYPRTGCHHVSCPLANRVLPAIRRMRKRAAALQNTPPPASGLLYWAMGQREQQFKNNPMDKDRN